MHTRDHLKLLDFLVERLRTYSQYHRDYSYLPISFRNIRLTTSPKITFMALFGRDAIA